MVVVILFYTKLYTLYKRGKVMEEHENLNNQDEVNEENLFAFFVFVHCRRLFR